MAKTIKEIKNAVDLHNLDNIVSKIRDITQKLIDDKVDEALKHETRARELYNDANKLRQAFNLLPKK